MRTTVALKVAAVVAFGSLVALGTRAAVRGQAPGGAAVNWALAEGKAGESWAASKQQQACDGKW